MAETVRNVHDITCQTSKIGITTGKGHIIKMPDLEYTPNPKGLGYLYYESMLQNKEKLAQIEGRTGRKDTFGQVLIRSIRVTLSLREKGVQPKDVLCVCSHNHLNSSVFTVACTFLGATISSLEPLLSLNEIIFLLKQILPKIIFVQSDAVQLIENAVTAIGCNAEIIVFGNHKNYISFEKLLIHDSDESNFQPYVVENLHETVAIFFSSGTTGYPKGVCLNHYAVMCQAANKTGGLDVEGTLMVSYPSPYWAVNLAILTISISKGLSRLVFPKYEPNRAWEMFDYKITYALINVAQLQILCAQGKPDHVRTDNLLDIHVCADTVSEEKMLQMRKMFPKTRVHLIYGQTEVPVAITMFDICNTRDLKFIAEKPISAGTGMYGMSYKITDVDTEAILGPNTCGELRVKTEFQTNGYLNLDSSIIWDSEMWLRTGDLAYYDEDFCFFIVGRIKEMLKFQCWHIIPRVLEDILMTNPAIENVVVIGVPHKLDGEWPMAIVILKPSYQNTKPEEIAQYLNSRVQDKMRLRAGVMIVPRLPLTVTGKINRKKVKETIIEDINYKQLHIS